MSEPQRRTGFFQRLWSRPEPIIDDAADYGTCFGLELSLGAVMPTTADARQPWQPRWAQRITPKSSRRS